MFAGRKFTKFRDQFRFRGVGLRSAAERWEKPALLGGGGEAAMRNSRHQWRPARRRVDWMWFVIVPTHSQSSRIRRRIFSHVSREI